MPGCTQRFRRAAASLHEGLDETLTVLRLNVRATQEAAIKLYEENGYQCWGILPAYEFVNSRMIPGHYFYKNLEPISNIL